MVKGGRWPAVSKRTTRETEKRKKNAKKTTVSEKGWKKMKHSYVKGSEENRRGTKETEEMEQKTTKRKQDGERHGQHNSRRRAHQVDGSRYMWTAPSAVIRDENGQRGPGGVAI